MKLSDLLPNRSDIRVGNIPIIQRSTERWFKDGRKFGNTKTIGAGRFSKVYNHPHNHSHVIKLSNISDDLSTDRVCKFVNCCLDNQDNPFFPKIYSAKIYKTITRYHNNTPPPEETYQLFCIMERLSPVTDHLNLLPKLLEQIGVSKSDIDLLLMPGSELSMSTIMSNKQKLKQMLKSASDPSFKRAITLMAPFLFNKKDSGFLDMHLGNWMIRNDGSDAQLVINDPVAPFAIDW